MKYLLLTISILFTSFAFAAISLQEAVLDKKVVVNILSNDNSTHYHTPFVLEVENISTLKQDLVLDNGTVLIADDAGEQDFIITQEELLALAPGKKIKVELFAMCLEQYKSAPNHTSSYSIGTLANKNLRKLSAFIEANKNFEPDAQFLMWDIAEGLYNEEQLDDFKIDSDGVVWVVNVIDDERVVLDREEIINDNPGPVLYVDGSFTMNFARPQNVHIAMFNDQNVIVKELYKDENCPAGESGLKYSFDSLAYPDEVYFVKLVVNGKVRLTRTIEMN